MVIVLTLVTAPLMALLWGALFALTYAVYVTTLVACQAMCALIATEQRYSRQRAYQQWCVALAAHEQAASQPKRRQRRRKTGSRR